MRSFQVIVDENGNSKFLDPADKAAFRSLLLAIYKSLTSKGQKAIYTITITTFEKRTSEKQMMLWRVLIKLISDESGNTQETVEATILSDFSKIIELPQQMTNSRFQELLLFATAFTQDFFGINIILTDDGQFKIQRE